MNSRFRLFLKALYTLENYKRRLFGREFQTTQIKKKQKEMWISELRMQKIMYQGKRRFNTFNEPTSGRSDWLCDASIKLAVLESSRLQGI